jgi:hypothetical protein
MSVRADHHIQRAALPKRLHAVVMRIDDAHRPAIVDGKQPLAVGVHYQAFGMAANGNPGHDVAMWCHPLMTTIESVWAT